VTAANMALQPTIQCIDNIQEEFYVVDSAVALLQAKTEANHKVLAIAKLEKLLNDTPYQNLKSDIASAIQVLKK
jgi:hypothetical protein